MSHLRAEQAEGLARSEDRILYGSRQRAADAWLLYEKMLGRLHSQADTAVTAVSGGLLVESRQLLLALAPEEAK
ncbi:hypothetical protein [Streptomyces sp. NPDC057428]|uniref:hypothetical protein n=1 Tax=Streptomyces sp. NPDC057428 TaxID=3346129 RepID=UPI0036756738